MSECEQHVEEDCFDTTAGDAEHLLVNSWIRHLVREQHILK